MRQLTPGVQFFEHSIAAAIARIRALLVIGSLLILVATACGPPLREASEAQVLAAQQDWQANPTLDYRIIVDVKRPGEARRYSLTVSGGEIERATMERREPTFGNRPAPLRLEDEQAFPFTVSGLFELVLAQLRQGSRREVLVAIAGRPAFPRRIELGPVLQDGISIEGTQSTILVRRFDPLDAYNQKPSR